VELIGTATFQISNHKQITMSNPQWAVREAIVLQILAREIDGNWCELAGEGKNQSQGLNFDEVVAGGHHRNSRYVGWGLIVGFDFAKFSFRPFLFQKEMDNVRKEHLG